MFSLELPHPGDSNEYTQYTMINIKKKITLLKSKYDNVCIILWDFFFLGLENDFELAAVNEPSMFRAIEVLPYLPRVAGKFHCHSVEVRSEE